MDATPRGVGEEHPNPQGGEGAPATGDGPGDDAHARAEERRGERMGRAERVRLAVHNGSLGAGLGSADDTDEDDVEESGAESVRRGGAGGEGWLEFDAAADAGAEREARGDAGAAATRRNGRVEYEWRRAHFDELDDLDGLDDPDGLDGRGGRGGPDKRGGLDNVSLDKPGGWDGDDGLDGHDGGSGSGEADRPDDADDTDGALDVDKFFVRESRDARPRVETPPREQKFDSWEEPEAVAGTPVSTPRPTRAAGPAVAPGTVPPLHQLTQLAVGDYLLTIGGADGSEVVPLPATSRPFSERRPAAGKSVGYPPLGRQAEITEVRGLLGRGTSVRVGGPPGIGRSTLLAYVASGDAVGAPDGVITLNGHQRGLDDLLQQFHDACYAGDPHRPTRAALAGMLADVAALVVIDDLDLAADEISELLGMAPECVFLVAVRSGAQKDQPDLIARAADSPFHELTLGGLPQEAAFGLLARAAGRELDDEELAWAAALWFEVDGHPGRFAQAGALLARLGTGVARDPRDAEPPGSSLEFDDYFVDIPIPELPSPGEPHLFAPRLVPLLSRPAQQVLRLGVALDGVLPDPAHLPALTGAVDAHGAAKELVNAGLVVAESGRHRLAGGVAEESAGLMRGPSSWAVAAIQHFTWWASHPTVTAAQVAAEADVILACLREVERLGKPSSVRVLARAAAPAFASALRFEAWRDCLELGAAASATSGASGEQAWFRHELAVLALCTGEPQEARELAAAATRLRDASDKRGLAADRRVLVLAGERPGGFGADTADAAAGRRRAAYASMAGKRGVMTLGAAAVLVLTLAVVVGIGSDDPAGRNGPSDISVTDSPLPGATSPVGAVVPQGTTDGDAGRPAAPTSSNRSGSATPSGSIRSTPSSKTPSATPSTTTTATRVTPTQPAPPPPGPQPTVQPTFRPPDPPPSSSNPPLPTILPSNTPSTPPPTSEPPTTSPTGT